MSRRAAREAQDAVSRRRPTTSRGRAASAPSNGALPAEGGDLPRKGIGGFFAQHPTGWLVGALAIVFVLLGTGAVFAGVSVGSAAAVAPSATPTPEPPRSVPDGDLTASRLRTCSVALPAADGRLMDFSGSVMRADTGEVLFDRGGTTASSTASVMKVLTAAAALSVLGPDYQIKTSVFAGSTPGSIVLVGRGDATLSALPAGSESVYKGAPKLDDLAAQVLAAYQGPAPITSIVLDASYWSSADKWDPSWKRSEQTTGYHSEVTALQVDGDRADPTRQTSPRSTDPIGRAGQEFLDALRAADTAHIIDPNVTFSTGTALGGTALLGEVQSQPLKTLINYMLQVSDNTLAEMLARITSKQSSLNGSAASLQQAIPSALIDYVMPDGGPGINGAGLTIRDGSGLSDLNAVPPQVIARLMTAINAGSQNLDVISSSLPIAGKTGTLASRYTGANAVARGHVQAKTGWIDTEYSEAGIIQSADGTVLTFAFYAIGGGIKDNAREALDTVATAVYTCGDNLSNN